MSCVKSTAVFAAAFLAMTVPSATRAIELADGKLTLHGNGSWAYRATDHNIALESDPDGEWETAMFDLLLGARPAPDIVLTAQIGMEPTDDGMGTGASLEWAFAEWRLSDLFRLRFGKAKHPFGNYGETQFVGTARPFFENAQSVYGPVEISATAYEGVGVTGQWNAESGYGVQYDLYGGGVEVMSIEPWEVPADAGPDFVIEEEEQDLENLIGGRVSLNTPWDVALRASAMGGRIQKDEGKTDYVVYGLSAFHRGEKLWASVEGFRQAEGDRESTVAAYAEAAWFLMEKLQVAARYELARTDLNEMEAPPRILRHDEVALGLNWWLTPDVVLKASAHQMWGYRLVAPEAGVVPQTDQTFAFVAGTQFTF